MQPFREVFGAAANLPRPNTDTDVIIRIERLTGVPRAEMGPYAFEALRYRPDGAENPDFVLNREPFRGAPILIAGRNFGCGSSREGAVWAMMGMGLRVVIAESFGDIFFANCFQNGMLPIVLPGPVVEQLAEAAAGGDPVRVDLERRVVVPPNGAPIPFEIDAQRREALLEGLDEIGRTLKQEAAIAGWQGRDHEARPWVWQVPG
jgi:3-isopropylmalate/(R)-2-methylmalate dehydratase small subunit